MNDIKKNFTENEWKLIQYAPVSICFALIITGFKITNFIFRIKEFAGVIPILNKCNEQYPNNLLIQESIGSIKNLESLSAIANDLEELSKDKQKMEEINKICEDEEVDRFMDELDSDKILKSMVHICLYPVVMVKAILKKKDITEKEDYFEALHKIAYDTAYASKEGFFGLGDRISQEENRILTKIKSYI